MKKFEVEILFIDFEEDSSTPFDSEWVEVEAEDEREAIKIATNLGYIMPNGFVSNSLTIEVQL